MSTANVMHGVLIGMATVSAEDFGFNKGYQQALAESQHQIDQGYNQGYNQARQDLQTSINSAFHEGFEKGTYNGIQIYAKDRSQLCEKIAALHLEKLDLLDRIKMLEEQVKKSR